MATALVHKMKIDPVCGMEVDPDTAAATICYNGTEIFFCAEGCKKVFETHPKVYRVAQRKRFWKRAILNGWAKPLAEDRYPATDG